MVVSMARAASVARQCRGCMDVLKEIVSSASSPWPPKQSISVCHARVKDELDRLSLWAGNIGALHAPDSPMAVESRLRDAQDVLEHMTTLLDDLNEVAGELLEIASGHREGAVAVASATSKPSDDGDDGEHLPVEEQQLQTEEGELLDEISETITRLFRLSTLIRRAAPTDQFARALSRSRCWFNDQFDIAHVGEKYPKLATNDLAWLRARLGRAITQRRQYLSYIQAHRGKLEGTLDVADLAGEHETSASQLPRTAARPINDSSSRPSTFFTKASTLVPEKITHQKLVAVEESDPEEDARSYTTISHSVDGDLHTSTTDRIPRLDELRVGGKKEVECPFCFRIKRFKTERAWRRHVFADLRPYVCTFHDCDAPYFSNPNEWFFHEMHNHRVSYACQLCNGKIFLRKERYLAHVRKAHPHLLEDAELQPMLQAARRPVDQIPAAACPCCSEWTQRLREQVPTVDPGAELSTTLLTVTPAVFRRHLASHLEQLALFAVPLRSISSDEVNSDVAIEETAGALSRNSDSRPLSFHSTRPQSAVLEEDLALELGFQKCFNCKESVESTEGGNHLICRCKAEFCMRCAAPWKTCNCAWFNFVDVSNRRRRNDISVPETPIGQPGNIPEDLRYYEAPPSAIPDDGVERLRRWTWEFDEERQKFFRRDLSQGLLIHVDGLMLSLDGRTLAPPEEKTLPSEKEAPPPEKEAPPPEKERPLDPPE